MKKLLIIIPIILIISLLIVNKAFAKDIVTSIDELNGLLTVEYNKEIEVRVKVMIEKDKEQYSYDLLNNIEVYPLQLGNGIYTVKIYEQSQGISYIKTYETSVELNMEDTNKVYLTSNQIVNWKEEDKVIQRAKALTKNMTTEKAKINAIYKYVVNTYKYDYNKINGLTSNYIPDINKVEAEKKGICYDYSVILAAMLRSQGIECKVVKGYSELTGNTYHAWNEIYLESEQKWITVDTTADSIYNENGIRYTIEKNSAEYSNVKEF